MDGDNLDEQAAPELDPSDWVGAIDEEAEPDSSDEPAAGRASVATRLFSPGDDQQSVRPAVNLNEEIGSPIYIGAAANVLDTIRKQHCLGRVPGSVLREHIRRRGGSVAHLHSGRWRIVPCTSLDEAVDFQAYLVQRLKPALNGESSPWKHEYSVLYHRFVQELYASPAVGCDELESRFVGPGVYVFYHRDEAFWAPVSEAPQEKGSSEFRLLKKAIALSRAGDKRPAREILAHVISSNPPNELAWLWYAYNLDRNSDRIRVLRECLHYNPECKEAKDRLIYLQTSEALRVRVEEHRGEIETRIARAETRLARLHQALAQGQKAVQEAEEAYESAKVRVEKIRREMTEVTAELDQLREQLAEL
jgi:tetratricopeptide (TPR) repeat protein